MGGAISESAIKSLFYERVYASKYRIVHRFSSLVDARCDGNKKKQSLLLGDMAGVPHLLLPDSDASRLSNPTNAVAVHSIAPPPCCRPVRFPAKEGN